MTLRWIQPSKSRRRQRQEQLVRDPSQQLAVKKQNDADELRLENFVRLLPSAFLFEYDGWDGSDLRLTFRPDPAFVPPTMESKALQSMAGTILVSPQQKRLARMNGHLVENVDFGFGILGRIAKGGTFEIERIQVSSSHWKTHLVDIHVNGRMLLFKTINKQQHETRSDFESVPQRPRSEASRSTPTVAPVLTILKTDPSRVIVCRSSAKGAIVLRPDRVDNAIVVVWLLPIGNRSCTVDHAETKNGIAK